MRQTQIQRKRQKRGGPDDTPDDMPTETSEHAAQVSRDAQTLLDKIDKETSEHA